MRKITLFLTLFLFIGLQVIQAQNRTITGKVTSAEDGSALPGVTVAAKGTTIGTSTDVDGKYSLSVPTATKYLVFSFIGMTTKEIEIGDRKVVDAVLEPTQIQVEGIVVTALGITREKKSLGYATQEVSGEIIQKVKGDNFLNTLSGKVSGVQIRRNTNMGGSTNVLMRGSKSITGGNQAMFVVDGVPVSNDITNTSSQKQAGQGFDYGNAAADINPDDIESINVLKGAAATALYGSRAANGVIMITTKKGAKKAPGVAAKQGIGVTFNTNYSFGVVDKSTFPKYQNDYGGGYGQYYDGPGHYWYLRDLNNDGVEEQWVVTSEDASYGAPFDPTLLVYQWDAVDPESPNYMTATPWVGAENGPIYFFNKPQTFTHTIAIENATTLGNYRLSYTSYKQKGILPNSQLKKDNILLNGTWNVNNRLTATGSANYIKNKALGRNSTGYSDNIMSSFRQWYQTNVDMKQQQDMYELTGRNVTWNYADPTDPVPIYWDNYYWSRYKNYQTDGRDRFIGYMSLNYKLTDWVDIFGRIATDFYNELQEERRAVGSIAAPFGIGTGTASDGSLGRADQGSGYLRRDITFAEFNYDLMANYHTSITKDLNVRGVVGMNIRRTNYNRLISATNGGLAVPEIYALQNSIGPLPYPKELASKVGVDGIYGSASFGYKDFAYIDITGRQDHSSTLPKDNSTYFYPSVAGSLIFSNLIKADKWLSFGKVRLNYAQVGNSAGFDELLNNYTVLTPFNSPVTSVPGTSKNVNLKPEKTNSIEAGLEMFFFGRRLGFDLAIYKTTTTNQIIPLTLSRATGFNSMYINAGEIENKGIELSIMGTPVKTKDFRWDITVNWAANKNKVVELYPEDTNIKNIQLGSFQGGVTINAMIDQPYGVIYGTDYQYNEDGKRIINRTNGRYLISPTSKNIIGNVNPDYTGGILNTLTYKNWSFGFLIDFQKGGDIFSLDMYYGLATGLYEETSFTNDLGNPVRNPVVGNVDAGYDPTSGGMINEGVNPDGTENKTRISCLNYGAFGYVRNPNKAFVYDASFVKLREISLTYMFPEKFINKTPFTSASFSVTGSNVWIISKNLPHADPESGLGAGNLSQGYSIGSLPTTRDFGFNLKVTF
ncbi:MAG: SusC/RagA family TonB-linked outer membrane protein [Bacteroidales bacterium]